MRYDESLTILLVLKGRVSFTFRWMSYANRINLPFKVLIADGGAGNKAEKLLSDKIRFPDVHYEYIRYPYDETLGDYYAKMCDVLSRVSTPYLLLSSNDDLFLIEGIRKALSFLEMNAEYISSRGEIYQFGIRPTESNPEMRYVFGPLDVLNPPYFRRPSILSDNALDRVRQQCKEYCSNYHDVHRTVYARVRFNLLKNLNPKDLRFADQINDILSAADGKVHRGKGLFGLHQCNTPGSYGQKVLDEFPTWFDWIQSPWWPEDFKNLAAAVANVIAKDAGISFDEACQQFKQSYFTQFVGPRLLEDLKHLRRSTTQLRASGPGEYEEKLRHFCKPLWLIYGKYRKLQSLNDNRRIWFSKYFDELKPIRDFLSVPPGIFKTRNDLD